MENQETTTRAFVDTLGLFIKPELPANHKRYVEEPRKGPLTKAGQKTQAELAKVKLGPIRRRQKSKGEGHGLKKHHIKQEIGISQSPKKSYTNREPIMGEKDVSRMQNVVTNQEEEIAEALDRRITRSEGSNRKGPNPSYLVDQIGDEYGPFHQPNNSYSFDRTVLSTDSANSFHAISGTNETFKSTDSDDSFHSNRGTDATFLSANSEDSVDEHDETNDSESEICYSNKKRKRTSSPRAYGRQVRPK
ncbi:MAG: hypothetical protein Q9213_005470 [Squamulea squamosa]